MPNVRVYLDEKPLIVPESVDCHHAARGALGLPRGIGVTREMGGAPIAFPDSGWTFTEGEHYYTVSATWLLEHGFKDAEQGPWNEPWAVDPDWWKL